MPEGLPGRRFQPDARCEIMKRGEHAGEGDRAGAFSPPRPLGERRDLVVVVALKLFIAQAELDSGEGPELKELFFSASGSAKSAEIAPFTASLSAPSTSEAMSSGVR